MRTTIYIFIRNMKVTRIFLLKVFHFFGGKILNILELNRRVFVMKEYFFLLMCNNIFLNAQDFG